MSNGSLPRLPSVISFDARMLLVGMAKRCSPIVHNANILLSSTLVSMLAGFFIFAVHVSERVLVCRRAGTPFAWLLVSYIVRNISCMNCYDLVLINNREKERENNTMKDMSDLWYFDCDPLLWRGCFIPFR